MIFLQSTFSDKFNEHFSKNLNTAIHLIRSVDPLIESSAPYSFILEFQRLIAGAWRCSSWDAFYLEVEEQGELHNTINELMSENELYFSFYLGAYIWETYDTIEENRKYIANALMMIVKASLSGITQASEFLEEHKHSIISSASINQEITTEIPLKETPLLPLDVIIHLYLPHN